MSGCQQPCGDLHKEACSSLLVVNSVAKTSSSKSQRTSPDSGIDNIYAPGVAEHGEAGHGARRLGLVLDLPCRLLGIDEWLVGCALVVLCAFLDDEEIVELDNLRLIPDHAWTVLETDAETFVVSSVTEELEVVVRVVD